MPTIDVGKRHREDGVRRSGTPQTRCCKTCGNLKTVNIDADPETTIRIGCQKCGRPKKHRPIASSRSREARSEADTTEGEPRPFDSEETQQALDERVAEIEANDGADLLTPSGAVSRHLDESELKTQRTKQESRRGHQQTADD